MVVFGSYPVDASRGDDDCGGPSIAAVEAARVLVSSWAASRLSSKPLTIRDSAGVLEFSIGDAPVTHGRLRWERDSQLCRQGLIKKTATDRPIIFCCDNLLLR